MAVTNARVLSTDTFYSLYSGRFVAAHGLPHVDTLTVAGYGRPWIDQQWLAHLAFFEAFRAGGYSLVGLLSAALIASAFAGFAFFLLTAGISPVRTTLWSIVAFFVCQPNTATRAESFAYPLFVLTLCLMLRDDRFQRWTWYAGATIPVLVIWANLHGSVILAAPLVVGYCVVGMLKRARGSQWRGVAAYACTSMFAAAAPFATPYGTAIFRYYGTIFNDSALAAASTEWHATTLSAPNLQFILLGVVLIALGGMALRRGYRPSPVLVAFTFVLAVAAIDSVRNQVWFAFPAVIVVTGGLSSSTSAEQPARRPSAVRTALIAVVTMALLGGFAFLSLQGPATERLQVLCLFVAVVLAVGTHRVLEASVVAVALVGVLALMTTTTAQFNRLTPATAISRATGFALRHPHVDVLADDFASGPMLWRTPKLDGRIGFDSRFEIYSQPALRDYAAFITGGPNWRLALRGYGMVVVSRFQNPGLVARMQRLSGWSTLFLGTKGAVFVTARVSPRGGHAGAAAPGGRRPGRGSASSPGRPGH
jgi:hypothetical protein